MSTTTDNRTLKERIIQILEDEIDIDTGLDGGAWISKKSYATTSNAIEELFLEEIGKAWDAAIKHTDFYSRQNHLSISSEKPKNKTEYLNSITQVKK